MHVVEIYISLLIQVPTHTHTRVASPVAPLNTFALYTRILISIYPIAVLAVSSFNVLKFGTWIRLNNKNWMHIQHAMQKAKIWQLNENKSPHRQINMDKNEEIIWKENNE